MIENLIKAGNQYDTEKYLSYFDEEAVLDDPSVGRTFTGHKGIKEYFVSYFIGYNTQTTLVTTQLRDAQNLFAEVAFTGDFPEGRLNGSFDFTFEDDKIVYIKADLIYGT
ncbi:nuclear transport factor 2 family protein [Niabella hibiscisoli]|uniref:nuclear transport factor 2 family protein n=1 Tax=Niabella hibiscisoli TaxID=1825928 RepID=UPI00374D6D08